MLFDAVKKELKVSKSLISYHLTESWVNYKVDGKKYM